MAYGKTAYIRTLDEILKADASVPKTIINNFVKRLRQDDGFYQQTRASLPLSQASGTTSTALTKRVSAYFGTKTKLQTAISGKLDNIDKWW